MSDEPQIKYDEPSDTLYISFAPGASATGVELNEHILLRIDRQRRTAVGLTLFDFSLLAQRTEMGPRSFPLSGLADVSDDLREMALEVLQTAPVREYLTLSAYTTSANQTVPITCLRSDKLTTRAA